MTTRLNAPTLAQLDSLHIGLKKHRAAEKSWPSGGEAQVRIQQYEVEVDQDYVTVENLSSPKLASAKSRPQRTIEYAFTLDMAKELLIVERTETGKLAGRGGTSCSAQIIVKTAAVKLSS